MATDKLQLSNKMHRNQVEFLLKTDKKLIRTFMKNKVDSKLRALDRDLDARRMRLKNILSEEDGALKKEMTAYEARLEEMKEIQKRVKAMQIEAQEESKRKEIVAEKEAQRERENSEDVKFKEFQEERVDVAFMQKQQALEKKKMIAMEKELDTIWEKISQDLHDSMEANEKRQKTLDVIQKKIYNEKLTEQIKEKMEMAKEELYERILEKFELEKLAEVHKKDLKNEIEAKFNARQELSRVKYENYRQSVLLKNDRQLEEKRLNEYYRQLNRYDPDEEKRKIQKTKEQVRAELALFKDSVASLRRKKFEDEKYEDELRKREATRMEQRETQIKTKEISERFKFEKDVLKMRMEQILKKKENTFRQS